MKDQDRRLASVAAGLVACAGSLLAQLPPTVSSGGIVNGASFKAPLSRCALASLFGTNLAATTASAPSLPLPTTFKDVQVIVNGIAAPLIYVSPTQINFQMPCELTLNGAAGVYVTNANGSSFAQNVTLAAYAPGVFTYARTATALDPIVVHLNNSLVTPSQPASPGEVLVVYATGVGNLNHLPVTGSGSPASPLSEAVDLPSVTVGGVPGLASFAGLSPGWVGLVQINIQLPATFPAGSSLPLVVSFAGAASPAVSLAVQGGTGPVSSVLVSDSFNRANAFACALGKADLAFGGSGSHYYEPLVTTSSSFGVSITSAALQNNSTDYSGVQFTASSDGCGNKTAGETIGQDLDIKVDLLVPATSAGMVQAGPYFRSTSVASGGGISGTTGYWVFLTSKGEVRVRKLTQTTTNTIVATTNVPSSFDASVFHTLETVVRGTTLQVYLDGKGLSFYQSCQNSPGTSPGFQCGGTPASTVTVPVLEGRNDGTAGIAFGDEDNRGQAAGQRARNLVVAQAGT